MKKKLLVWVISLIVLGVAIYAVLAIISDSVATNEIYEIGIILPLSGRAAYYGEAAQRGIEIAQEELGEKFSNKNIQVHYEDSAYIPKKAVDAYRFLEDRHDLDAVITAASHVSLAILPLTTQDEVIQMAVFSSANKYSTLNDLSFRISTKNKIEARTVAEFIQGQGYEKLAILYLNNDFGLGFKNALKEQLVQIGANTKVLAEESYVLEDKDFRTSLSKIKAKQPDVLFMVGTAAHYSTILRQAEELNIQTQFLSMRSAEDPVLLNNAGNLANGLVYTYPFDATESTKETKNFVEAFIIKYGTVPDAYAAEGYEGFKLVAFALLECDEDKECIKKYFQEKDGYASVFGPLSFNEYGDVYYSFFIKTVLDGKFVPLRE